MPASPCWADAPLIIDIRMINADAMNKHKTRRSRKSDTRKHRSRFQRLISQVSWMITQS